MPARVFVLLLVYGGIATAQQFSVACTVKAEPLTVRAEGVTELVGDLVLRCTGGTPTPAGKPVPLATVQVFLTNTNITSRLLSTDSGLSEATLLIDDPPPGQQNLCTPPGGICAVTAPYSGTTPNVFNAVVAAPNSVMWPGVPIDPPGDGKQRVLRITNVRGDASKMLSEKIVMAVVVSCSPPVLLDTSQQTVAIAQTGLVAAVSNPARIPQCGHNAALLCGGSGSSDFAVTVTEGFADAFRPRNIEGEQNVPGRLYHTESGFYDRKLFTGNPNLGRADFGTRIRLRFGRIGDGVSLFVPVEIALDVAGVGRLRLVDTNPYGDSPPGFKPVQATATVNGVPAAKVIPQDGIGYAVYEVLSSDPYKIETATIFVAVAVEVIPANNLPAPGQVTVSVSLAPVDDAPTDSVPRFHDTSTPLLAYEIVVCPPPGPFTCAASAVPATVRAEGIAELVGDLVLTCTGGTPVEPGAPIPLSTVRIALNTNITSRLLDANMKSEATLLIDELNACGSGSPIPAAILGKQSSPTSIVFEGVPISPPPFGETRVIRITNVRADACLLGLSTTPIPTQIAGFVAVTGGQFFTINNPQQTVALLQQGLVVNASSGTGVQCVSQNTPLIDNAKAGSNGFNFFVTVREGFTSSFKRRNIALTADGVTSPEPLAQNVPGYPYNTETGFYAPDLFTERVGLADFGTRILLTFNNIGKGVRIFTPTAVALTVGGDASTPPQPPSPAPPGITTGSMILVSTDQYGNSLPGFAAVEAASAILGPGVAEVNYNGTTGYAVYEVVNSDPNAIESASIPVAVAYTGNPSQALPSPGLTSVNVNFAPVGGPLAGIQTSDPNAPIPRFCDVSTPKDAFTINVCTCNLLFPFVTQAPGFDTGIAIANTTTDPYGTAPQTGQVSMYFHGQSTGGGALPEALAMQKTTGNVPSGQVMTWTTFGGAGTFADGLQPVPGFTGYVIAIANFQYCYGFAFISDLGAQRLAEGYLAIQLDNPFAGLKRIGIVGEVQGH